MSEAKFEVIRRLRSGEPVSDHDFDELYSVKIRKMSGIHWSEISVSQSAARFLGDSKSTRVLDVGSGIGKFCIVGALCTEARFVGVELRAELCRSAQEVVKKARVERVSIAQGDVLTLDWSEYSAFYLFNPFYESSGEVLKIDQQIAPDRKQHLRFVRETEAKLRALPDGTRIATYHGFGGEMPPEYSLIERDADGQRNLDFWVKSSSD